MSLPEEACMPGLLKCDPLASVEFNNVCLHLKLAYIKFKHSLFSAITAIVFLLRFPVFALDNAQIQICVAFHSQHISWHLKRYNKKLRIIQAVFNLLTYHLKMLIAFS